MNLKTKELIWSDSPHRALIAIVGYAGLPLHELRPKAKELLAKFKEEALNEAFKMVIQVEEREPFMVRLVPEVRPVAWPILGPDPDNPLWWAKYHKEPATASQAENAPIPAPAPMSVPASPKKRTRKKPEAAAP
jgi:hypothetical protein